jgi:RNA polymerase sigma factor (sigma-70 family)
MSTATLATALGCLRRAAEGRSDRQLLEAYAAANDQAAFATLVRRHGPMVLGVCRRVLQDAHHAEDAFQAVFLVLAKKASLLHQGEALTGWLHGVSYRVALRARRDVARRRKHERRIAPRPNPPAWEVGWGELQGILDEEVAQLPPAYREVFVLCCLDGLSGPAAAARLGIKENTAFSRLARARKRLQAQLGRRGISLSAVLTALAVSGRGRAALPPPLAGRAVEAAVRLGAGAPVTGLSARAFSLAEGVTPTMLSIKVQLALLMLVLCGLGASLGLLARSSAEAPAAPAAPAAAVGKPPAQGEAEGICTFAGRVLDPDGKPVAGARVMLQQRRWPGESADFYPKAGVTTGTTDAQGRFRFFGAVHLNAPSRARPPLLTLTAHVPGSRHGPAATVTARSADELKDCTLRLVKDDVPIRGRILNLEGKPIPAVTVRPVAVVANAANDLGRLVKAIETNTRADLPSEQQTNIVFSAAEAGLTQTARTDPEGKFTLSGFGRERIVVLRLDGPTIETCLLNAMTRRAPAVRATRPRGGLGPPGGDANRNATYVFANGATFDFAAGPGIVVEGVVRDQDTRRPLAGVAVGHEIANDSVGWAEEELTTTTDDSGRYRLVGLSRLFVQGFRDRAIEFVPPPGQPYLPAGFSPLASKLDEPVKLDVGLKRATLIKGRVTDKATGRPVQAVVTYFAFRDNPNLRTVKGFVGSQVVSSKKDGSFTLVVLPGRGIVAAKTDEMRRGTYLNGQRGNTITGLFNARIGAFVTAPYTCAPAQFDTLVGIEPGAKADADSAVCEVRLDPGKTVKGTILDPDGKPLAGVSIRGPLLYVSIGDLPSAAFTIPAVNPDKPAAYFFEHKKKLAAAVLLKGNEAEGFTLKLKPTATITGRLVTEDGEPIRNGFIDGRLEAGQLNMTQGWNGFFWSQTGGDGRFKIEGLLPEVKLGAFLQADNLFANLTLKPGEIRNLGDRKVKKIPE